ncbi:hypothetical protein KR200_011684 [Drosophila serrata]|nr:hypothetical protein KR200_011684 [Drosophila serrata]
MFEFTPKVGSMVVMLMMLLLVLSPVDSRWTRRPRRTTTPRSTTEKADRHQYVHHWPPLVAPPAAVPAPVPSPIPAPIPAPVPSPISAPIPAPSPPQVMPSPSPRLIDSFDRRSADGEYEFRFQLDNGNTRYERAYWLPVGKDLVLAKKGYYSVPLPNDQFSTIFYTADNRGYHVDMQTLSGERPLLPRSLEVPGVATKMELVTGMGTGTSGGAGTKRNSISDPERNEQDVENVENVVDGDEDTSVAGTERVPNAVSQVETETETEPEPSTLANDILATEAADDDDDDDDDDEDGAAPDDVVDDEGVSN